LEHGVAQKFQPLVVLNAHTLLVGDGRVGQSQPQQALAAKDVSESGLESGEVGHWDS
jgi:hypothetical protein